MKSLLKISILILSLASAPSNLTGQTSQTPSDSPATRRLNELVQLINAPDRAAATAYIQKNYNAGFLNLSPMDDHLGFIFQVHDRTRGLEVHSFQTSTQTEASAFVKSKLTGDWRVLIVRVESAPPHLIAGIGMRLASAPAGERPARKLTEEEMVKELDAFVKKLAAADAFSGAALLAKDGRPIYKKAFGEASKEFNVPNRTDTKFNLGSMNKMFTSVAIAQLVERGKLSFDDPLSKFLPDFPDKESAEKIKIKHLLTHTSGLGSYFNRKFMESSRARFRTVNDMMELAKEEKLAFEPGARWQYSNTGMLVLGAVIEKASGQSYFDYIRENIYRPAGMTNSDCYELDLVTPNLALGYEKEFAAEGVRFRNNLFMHVIRGGPAGGGYSTVEDLLRFDTALRSGKLVGQEYVKLLTSAKPEINSPDYGYGFSIDKERGIVGHSGGFPGISSNLDMFLENGFTAVVMSNYGGGSQAVTSKMRELVLAGRESPMSKR
ncbi:MAG: beta-lactamase family protein [Blastocatellia bacterium]|nr:beta-lactamase family protein [Blastocatellia bacterium]